MHRPMRMRSVSCCTSGRNTALQVLECSPAGRHSYVTRRRIPIGYVIDTWVWVEYWLGNEAMKEWIEGQNPIFTSTITLAETVRYFVAGGKDRATIRLCLDDIRVRSTVVPVDETIA